MKTITWSRLVLPAILILCCVSALILTSSASSEGPGRLGADRTKAPIRMFDVGLGPHTFKVQMGRDTESHYLGGSPLQQALQTGQAQPRTMVGDDFNGDGMGDLIVGYANNGSGILSFRMGNVQAIAPADHAVFEGVQQGRYPAPFLPETRLYSLPEVPDFLQVGDFNADGYEDVLAAARGGAALYLLAGDGRGNLGAVQDFQLSGSLTALQANDSRQPGVFTSLAVGLRTDEGTKALIYNQAGHGLAGEPESYSMPGDVTSFAFGRLDDDGDTDLAAATTNQVLVIHGRSDQSTNNHTTTVETQSLPFVINGLAVGDFVWDRDHEREIAVLSNDGTVYLSARGNPDTRPYTEAELITLRDLKRSYTRSQIDMETFRAETNKLIRPNLTSGWKVAQTINTGVTPSANGANQALFKRLDASTLPTDDLLIGNGLNNHLQMVRNDHDAAKLKIQATTKSVDLNELSADSAPIAAVSMRMNIDSRPGAVVLKEGNVEPEMVILSPDATFNVTSNADLADSIPTAANGVCLASNGQCTLRAAIMQSNHTGGSNAITVPDNTYTLSLGTPDDETHTGGATEQSGDLDIFNWNPFDASPVLTAVSITGGTRDGCIVQVGTFTAYTPASGVAVPNNKERVLEINDGATIQSKINVTLTNLTFQNGVSPTNDGTFLDGGAIWYDGSNAGPPTTNVGLLTLHNVKITGNTSAGSGGGVHAQFGSLKVESTSIVRANSSQHKVGGGVEYNGGNSVETQFLLIDGSTIGGAAAVDGNQATDTTFGAGGGLDTRGGGTGGATNGIVISNSTLIQNNIAHSVNGVNGGGGIQLGNGPVFAFSNSTISNNSAKNMAGGLLSNAVTLGGGNATITLTSMNITGNTADSEGNGVGDGGGIYNFCGSLVITGTSHIDGNTAVNGGGIFNTWNGINTGANLTMTNGTIGQTGAGNGNNAKGSGGGFAINPGAPPTPGVINLNTVSIANNTANSDNSGGGDGGGIFVATGNLSSLNGSTVDSNVANAGTGDGIFMSGGTITAAGTLTLSGDDSLSINGGTFTSTAGIFDLAGNFTRAAAGAFTHNSGTLNFNGAGAQNINGTAASETFNNFTVNKTGTLSVGGSTTSLTIAGNTTLTTGTFAAGTAATITMNGTGGNWTNNGGTFTPGTSTVAFTNTAGAQAINGSAATQTFNNITVAKTAQTLSVAGSTTTLNLNGSMLLTSGTFSAGTAANINVGGDWTNNGGTFTPGTGTVTFNGGGAQNLNGTAATQTFNNFTVNKGGGTLTGGGSTSTLTLGGNLTISAGAFATGATLTTINVAGNWANTGTFTPGASNTVVFNGAGNTQTLTGTSSFNNLTINHTGIGSVTASGSTLSVTGLMRVQAGTFTTSSTFNNVQIDSGATLASDGNTINVSGNWTNNGGTFTPSTGTVNFNGAGAQAINGTAATQTFNNLTVNKAGGALSGAGSLTTLTITANFTNTAGTFAPGALTINVGGNWAQNATFTSGTSTVIFNGNDSTQTLSGSSSFNNLTSNHTGTGGVTASGSTLAVTGLFRIQAGSFISSSTFNNVQIDSGATLASDGSTMNVSGNWTNNSGTFTPSTGTVNFNGAGAQAINGTAAAQTFNNFIVNKSAGALSTGGSTTSLTTNNFTLTAGTFTAPATIDINGNVVLTAGTYTAGATTTVAGNWTNNGATFTAGAGTVTFDGAAGQTIGGTTATTFNNLTNGDAGGISMSNDNTVNGALALTASDITVAATKTLTQPAAATSSGTFDVNGRVQRTGFTTGGPALSFGNPFNTIQVTAGTAPANIVVDLARSVPAGFTAAIQRTYTITPAAGVFTGTLRLHYLDTELNGNTEAGLIFRRFNGTGWSPVAPTSADTTNNWLQATGVTQFSPWTMNSTNVPTATTGTITGRITAPDGSPVAGTVVNLNGAASRKTITDANGNYKFTEVETSGFYTVTPARANYNFTPANRAFAQIGDTTEAAFTGTSSGDNVNPLDTPEYFVRQQYVDVLGREPDEGGFNYWSNQLLACGADGACVRSTRTTVAAAFFVEQEFKQSGAFIYDAYAAALGRRPGYSEYATDRTTVVGGPTLDIQKQQFAQAFVNRSEFAGKYESNNTAASFVDALLSNSTNASSLRDNLIARYNQGANQNDSRALVVLDLIDSAAVRDANYNSAFVLVEYFGYLHRDPDQQGYDFWRNVLNNTDANNYRGMVCSFITSTEYQHRFSNVVSHNNGECGQ